MPGRHRRLGRIAEPASTGSVSTGTVSVGSHAQDGAACEVVQPARRTGVVCSGVRRAVRQEPGGRACASETDQVKLSGRQEPGREIFKGSSAGLSDHSRQAPISRWVHPWDLSGGAIGFCGITFGDPYRRAESECPVAGPCVWGLVVVCGCLLRTQQGVCDASAVCFWVWADVCWPVVGWWVLVHACVRHACGCVGFRQSFLICRGFSLFLVESLILAQDERWRRA